MAQLCPTGGCNDGGVLIPKVFICEAVCTFCFVSMVLMVAKHNGSEQMPINAFIIGASLYLAIQMASGISGGCINPVVGLFQTLFQRFANKTIFPNAPETQVIYGPAYVFGPLLGGFFAAFYHKIMHEKAIETSRTHAEQYCDYIIKSMHGSSRQ